VLRRASDVADLFKFPSSSLIPTETSQAVSVLVLLPVVTVVVVLGVVVVLVVVVVVVVTVAVAVVVIFSDGLAGHLRDPGGRCAQAV
jgi:hypothetical protein